MFDFLSSQGGKFSVIPLFLNLGSGLALLGIVSIQIDIDILFYCFIYSTMCSCAFHLRSDVLFRGAWNLQYLISFAGHSSLWHCGSLCTSEQVFLQGEKISVGWWYWKWIWWFPGMLKLPCPAFFPVRWQSLNVIDTEASSLVDNHCY